MQEREGVGEIMTTNHSNISATCPGEWPASQPVTKPDVGHIVSRSLQGDSRSCNISASFTMLPRYPHHLQSEQDRPLAAT